MSECDYKRGMHSSEACVPLFGQWSSLAFYWPDKNHLIWILSFRSALRSAHVKFFLFQSCAATATHKQSRFLDPICRLETGFLHNYHINCYAFMLYLRPRHGIQNWRTVTPCGWDGLAESNEWKWLARRHVSIIAFSRPYDVVHLP